MYLKQPSAESSLILLNADHIIHIKSNALKVSIDSCYRRFMFISLSFCDFIFLPLPSWFIYVVTFSMFKSPVALSTNSSVNSHSALFIVYSWRIFSGRLRSFERAGKNELPNKLSMDSF